MNSKEWKLNTRHISPMTVGTDAVFIVGGLIRDLEATETNLQISKVLATELKARISEYERMAAMPYVES